MIAGAITSLRVETDLVGGRLARRMAGFGAGFVSMCVRAPRAETLNT